MKQTRFGIILSLTLACAAGAAAGVFAEKFLFANRAHHRYSDRAPSPQQWEKDLGLSEEQKTRIHEIFKNNDGRIDTLRSDFFKHVEEIRSEIKKEIDAVLTPEQKAKMDAMMEKFREARKKDADRQPSGSDSRPKDGFSKENNDEKEDHVGSGDSGRDRGGDPDHFPY
ncbi:MAG: Spy/CpxP family protein refolding chaperone [Candidatus Aminicenantales bacterium]